MEPRRNEHTIGSSESDNFRPREDKGMAFSHAEAPSDDIARSRALSSSSGALSINFWCKFVLIRNCTNRGPPVACNSQHKSHKKETRNLLKNLHPKEYQTFRRLCRYMKKAGLYKTVHRSSPPKDSPTIFCFDDISSFF